MKQDRFLIGILVAIGLLVAVSLVLFFVRRDNLTYGSEDSPAGVIRNYVIAIQQQDYERAYGYLADKANKPTFEQFRQAFISRQLIPSGAGMQIGDERPSGQEILVTVTIIHSSSGPFSDPYRSPETAVVVNQNGKYRISQMPYPYWGWDWYSEPVVPLKAPTN